MTPYNCVVLIVDFHFEKPFSTTNLYVFKFSEMSNPSGSSSSGLRCISDETPSINLKEAASILNNKAAVDGTGFSHALCHDSEI